MAGLFDDVVPQATKPADEKPPETPGLFNDVLHPGAAAKGGLFEDVLAKQPDPDTSTMDLSAPVGSEGFLGGVADVGRGLAHGAMVDLPQQVGQTAQNFGRELGNQNLAQWGDETVAAAKARDEAHPEFKQSIIGQRDAQDWTSVRGGAYGAGSNTPLSTGPGLAAAATGAGIGAFAGPGGALAGAGIGYVVGSLASLPLFYGGQGQQSYEEIKKRLTAAGGHTPEEIEHAATVGGRISGGIEAGGELAEDFIPFHQLFHPLAKPVKGMLVKSLFSGGLRKAAATIGEQELGEVTTETAQQYLEDETEGRYGGGQGGTLKGAAQVIMPTALMTLLPGGLTAVHNFRNAHQLKTSLTDGAINPEQRAAAAKVVFHEIAGTHGDDETAKAFDEYATIQIARGAPIELGSDDFYKQQVERPDYQAALDHLEQNPGNTAGIQVPGETPDYGAAQQQLEAGETPDYGAAQAQLNAGETPDYGTAQATLEGDNPDYDKASLELAQRSPLAPDTPIGNAATIAHATGAAQNAAAARQTEVDEATHAAAGENAAEGDSEPPAPPPANPITGALFPFAKVEAAQKRAELLQEQTGQAHTVIPHPFRHDAFAVVPGEQIEAAPAPGDKEAETQGQAGDKTPETQGASPVGRYRIDNPINGDGAEDVRIISSQGGREHAIVQADGTVIDIGNMLRAGFSPEKAIAVALGDHVDPNQPQVDKVHRLDEGESNGSDVPVPAAGGTKEAPGAQRPGENIEGHPADESGPQGPGEGPGAAAQGEKGALSDDDLEKLYDEAAADVAAEKNQAPADEKAGGEAKTPPESEGGAVPNLGDGAIHPQNGTENAPETGKSAESGTSATSTSTSDESGIIPGQGPLHPGTGEPATPGQILGENATLQHATVAGLPLTIENAAGSTRTDLKHTPPAWSRTMTEHYGRIKGTLGADGDHVDAFVKPGTTAEHAGPVFVIDQANAAGAFDEHKVMLGYPNQPAAVAAYRANYPASQQVGPVTQTSIEGFKDWLAHGDTTQPFAQRAQAAAEPTVPVKVIEAESGRQAIVQMPATQAVAHYDEQLDKARGMLQCLLS